VPSAATMQEPTPEQSPEPPDSGAAATNRKPALVFAATMVVLVAVAAIVLSAGGDEEGTASGELACTPAPGEGGDLDCPPELVITPATVLVETNHGDFSFSLDVEASPATTTSVRYLVEQGFYDGLDFHRVVPGFVLQGGDPQGDGSGGPGYYVDEPPPPGTTYERGTVAMAKTGTDPAGRSGSQFFIISGQQAGLPPEYAYVGEIESGQGTIRRIEGLGDGDGPPSEPVTIERMTVEPAS
jgi:peptidyl-prolyl cis-trans isomerase B (cyclophilin B)